MEHLFDFELAGGLQVGAAASSLGEDGAILVGEQAHRLGAARVDAEDMHHDDMLQPNMPALFPAARAVLQRAVAERAFPAAVIEVGDATRPLWREAFGTLTFDAASTPTREDTIFDLASLTKVLATTALAMRDVEQGTLGLDDRLSEHLPRWRRADGDAVTIRDLLSHSSGLPAHLPLFRDHTGREAFEAAICAVALEYPPRARSVYSDLGFMLLGFLLERTASLPARFDALKALTGSVGDLQFHPPEIWRPRTAPAHVDPWRGRLLIGEVDDENAWALGGAAGHAGLFGTAAAVGDQARHLLQVLDGRAGAFSRSTLERVHRAPARDSGQLEGARVGHDAAHVVVRNAHVEPRVRPHRVYRHVALDGSGSARVRGPADQPRVPGPAERGDHAGPTCRARRRDVGDVTPADAELKLGAAKGRCSVPCDVRSRAHLWLVVASRQAGLVR